MVVGGDQIAEVAVVIAADKVTTSAVLRQGVGQSQAAPEVTVSDMAGRVNPQRDVHAACCRVCVRRAANMDSARSQSSGVSMSCTSCVGRITGTL